MGPRNTACHIEAPFYRDPPEPTGDEPEDFEYEAPKIYEPVSIRLVSIPGGKGVLVNMVQHSYTPEEF